MGRIRGHYEWDDDQLTPGRKKEGGLHQNLFDSAGKLKGSARFIPDDRSEPGPLVVTETVYVPVEQRRLTREQAELEQAIAALVSDLIDLGIARAKPIAARWWRDAARPAIAVQRAKVLERRSRRNTRTERSVLARSETEPAEKPAGASEETRPDMSSAEAGARYFAALAARAYSDEQIRLVMNAHIVDAEGLEGFRHSLVHLSSEEVHGLIEAMATDPSLLGEDSLAELASILGRGVRRQISDRGGSDSR